MGELITAESFKTVETAVVPAGSPLPNSSGFSINMSDIKDIISLVRDGLREFKEIAQMREQMQPKPAPLNYPDPNAPQLNAPVIKQEVKMENTIYVVDREKLKQIISQTIKAGDKLPQDIKDSKIGDILGEKWESFNYNYNGIIIDSKFLTEQIAEQLANQVDKIIIPAVTK